MKITPSNLRVGDEVSAKKFVYDRWYAAEGRIEAITYDAATRRTVVKIAGDYYDASDIKNHRPYNSIAPMFQCHYCGGPAIGFGPFDEPACRECGG